MLVKDESSYCSRHLCEVRERTQDHLSCVGLPMQFAPRIDSPIAWLQNFRKVVYQSKDRYWPRVALQLLRQTQRQLSWNSEFPPPIQSRHTWTKEPFRYQYPIAAR